MTDKPMSAEIAVDTVVNCNFAFGRKAAIQRLDEWAAAIRADERAKLLEQICDMVRKHFDGLNTYELEFAIRTTPSAGRGE